MSYFLSSNSSGSDDLTGGTVDAYLASLRLQNLAPNETIKTDADRKLITSALGIDDVQNLQATLDAKLSNPMTQNLDLAEFEITNTKANTFSDLGTPPAPPVGQLKLFTKDDGIRQNLHTIDENGVELKIGEANTFNSSTGLLSGCILSVGAPNNTFSLTSGEGILKTTATGAQQSITIPAYVNQAITNLATSPLTYILINSGGLIVQQTVHPTLEERTSNIYIGVISHLDNLTVNSIFQTSDNANAPLGQLRELSSAIGNLNVQGNRLFSSTPNLSLQRSAGEIFMTGIGYADGNVSRFGTKTLPPWSIALGGTFSYMCQDGSYIPIVNLVPTFFDNGGGIGNLGTVGATEFAGHWVYVNGGGDMIIQLAQQTYDTIADVEQGIVEDNFVVPAVLVDSYLLIGQLIMRGNCTNLLDAESAKILNLGRFGASTVGNNSIAVSDLQDAYLNSSDGKITTDTVRTGLKLQRGSALDTDVVLDVRDGAGVANFSVTGEGNLIAGLYNGVDLEAELDGCTKNPATANQNMSNFNITSVNAVSATNLFGVLNIPSVPLDPPPANAPLDKQQLFHVDVPCGDFIYKMDDSGNWNNIENLETCSTGLVYKSEMTISTATSINISDGCGKIITAIPRLALQTVQWTGLTNVSMNALVPTITGQPSTYIAIDSNGDVIQRATKPSQAEQKTFVYLGIVIHPAGVIVDIQMEPNTVIAPSNTIMDLSYALGRIKINGNIVSGSVLLTLFKTQGEIFSYGSNYSDTNMIDAHVKTLGSINTNGADSFVYLTSDAIVSTTAVNLDTVNYDTFSGGGVVVPLSNNKFTIQYIFVNTENKMAVQYGQHQYDSMVEARAGISDSFTINPAIIDNSILLGFVITSKNVADLTINLGVDTLFIQANRFGDIGSAVSGSTVSGLQDVYNNGSAIDVAVANPITVRALSAVASDPIIEFKKQGGTTTTTIDSLGILANTMTVNGKDVESHIDSELRHFNEPPLASTYTGYDVQVAPDIGRVLARVKVLSSTVVATLFWGNSGGNFGNVVSFWSVNSGTVTRLSRVQLFSLGGNRPPTNFTSTGTRVISTAPVAGTYIVNYSDVLNPVIERKFEDTTIWSHCVVGRYIYLLKTPSPTGTSHTLECYDFIDTNSTVINTLALPAIAITDPKMETDGFNIYLRTQRNVDGSDNLHYISLVNPEAPTFTTVAIDQVPDLFEADGKTPLDPVPPSIPNLDSISDLVFQNGYLLLVSKVHDLSDRYLSRFDYTNPTSIKLISWIKLTYLGSGVVTENILPIGKNQIALGFQTQGNPLMMRVYDHRDWTYNGAGDTDPDWTLITESLRAGVTNAGSYIAILGNRLFGLDGDISNIPNLLEYNTYANCEYDVNMTVASIASNALISNNVQAIEINARNIYAKTLNVFDESVFDSKLLVDADLAVGGDIINTNLTNALAGKISNPLSADINGNNQSINSLNTLNATNAVLNATDMSLKQKPAWDATVKFNGVATAQKMTYMDENYIIANEAGGVGTESYGLRMYNSEGVLLFTATELIGSAFTITSLQYYGGVVYLTLKNIGIKVFNTDLTLVSTIADATLLDSAIDTDTGVLYYTTYDTVDFEVVRVPLDTLTPTSTLMVAGYEYKALKYHDGFLYAYDWVQGGTVRSYYLINVSGVVPVSNGVKDPTGLGITSASFYYQQMDFYENVMVCNGYKTTSDVFVFDNSTPNGTLTLIYSATLSASAPLLIPQDLTMIDKERFMFSSNYKSVEIWDSKLLGKYDGISLSDVKQANLRGSSIEMLYADAIWTLDAIDFFNYIGISASSIDCKKITAKNMSVEHADIGSAYIERIIGGFYETNTLDTDYTASIWGAVQPITLQMVRVGRLVNLSCIVDVNSTQTTVATSVSTITAIPTQFRPSGSYPFIIRGSNASSETFLRLLLNTAGTCVISPYNATTNVISSWAGTGTGNINKWSITYSTD